MKRIIILLVFLASTTSAVCQTSSLEDGNKCFDSGNYTCAISKYNEVIKTASGKDKQIAQINLGRAISCLEWLTLANQTFTEGNFKIAKENYQNVLNENPKDPYATAQLEKCNYALITLKVSKNQLSFLSSGGTETISVSTEAASYSLNEIPSWCTAQKDEKSFIISSTPNTSNASRNGFIIVNAGNKIEKISIFQGIKDSEISLILSPQKIVFRADGNRATIDIKTNATDYTVTDLPSWCIIGRKDSDYFSLITDINNTGRLRSALVTVTAGNKSQIINISQSSKESGISLTTSVQTINFLGVGSSAVIDVVSNAKDYKVTNLPTWCKIGTIKTDWFSLSCEANNTGQSRKGLIIVTAGDKEVRINISQDPRAGTYPNSGTQKSNTTASYNKQNQVTKTKCFNCPKTKDKWGLTFGYLQMAYDPFGKHLLPPSTPLNGIRFGLRKEPLYKYGFGFNTGMLFDFYSNDLEAALVEDGEFSQFALNIPLHLQYRLNFSKSFNVFVYGGGALNVVTDSSFDEFALPGTLEYGAGLRLNRVQFNLGKSLYMGTFKGNPGLGENRWSSRKDALGYQDLVFTMSYMF
jgi:hypothetical protein